MTDLQKEVRESKVAAREVLRRLDEVERTLRGARNWGFFDLFSIRSFLASLVKFC